MDGEGRKDFYFCPFFLYISWRRLHLISIYGLIRLPFSAWSDNGDFCSLMWVSDRGPQQNLLEFIPNLSRHNIVYFLWRCWLVPTWRWVCLPPPWTRGWGWVSPWGRACWSGRAGWPCPPPLQWWRCHCHLQTPVLHQAHTTAQYLQCK